MKHPLVLIAVVCFWVGAILAAENILLQRGRAVVEDLERQNDLFDQGNRHLAKEVVELRAGRARIEALYLRLKDSVASPQAAPVTSRPLLHPDDATGPDPRVVQQFNDAGIITQPDRTMPGEMAQVHEAGASRLELHRLIPLLAEQENSNAFLFIDRVVLTRPASVPPFSLDPTYVDARFTFRLMSSK